MGSLQLTERGSFVDTDNHADIAVVVVTYNSVHDLPLLITDLRRDAKVHAIRVIVVDNASQDGSADVADAHPDIVVVRSPQNAGFGAGINQARPHLGSCSTVLILNPDVRVHEGAIQQMLKSLEEPGVGAVVPLNITGCDGGLDTTLRREPSISRALGDALLGGRRFVHRPAWLSETDSRAESYTREHAVDWATGSALLIRVDVAQAVGDWNEEFFMYSEEIDYCRRIRERGFLVWFGPSAIVEHPGGGGGSGRTSALATLQAVNRIRYIEGRHGKAYAAAFRAVVVFSSAIRGHREQHRDALPYLLNRNRWSELPHGPSPSALSQRPIA